MPTTISRTMKQPDEIADMLKAAIGCHGTCTYTVSGSTTTVTGSCTGAGTCPSCPSIYSQSTLALVKKLPEFFPNPHDWTVTCGLVSADAPILKLFDEYALLFELASEFKSKSNLYRTLAILLGVVSLLSLCGLMYTLIAR